MKPLAKLEYDGVAIRDRDGKLNMTDMWRAGGADPARRPSKWLASADARRFQAFLAETSGIQISDTALIEAASGGDGAGGATWAHWQLGLAYAKYLSPAFHAWGNKVIRDRMEGRIGSPEELVQALAAVHSTALDAKQYGGITKAVVGRALEDFLTPVHVGLAHITEKLERLSQKVDGQVEDRTAAPAREYVSALDFLVGKGVPQKGRRGVVQSVSARLLAFSATNGFTVRSAAETGTRLFHVDAVKAWEVTGGTAFLRACRDRREGQAVMPLQPGKKRALAAKPEARA